MKVSIVVVNWNRKRDLHDTLASVRSQNYSDLEITVVDNSSTDGSAEMVKQDFPEANLITLEKPLSACQSYNMAMKRSKGDIVVILDNDVVLGEGWIRRVIGELENDPTVAIVASRIVNFYSKEEIWGFGGFTKDQYSDIRFECTTFIGCAAAIRSRVLHEVGYYPEEFEIYVNEADLAARVLRAGYKIEYNPTIVAFHKISSLQRRRGRRLFYNTRNFIWYYWRYYPFPQVLVATLARTAISLFEAIRKHSVRLFLRALKETLIGLPSQIRIRTPLTALRRRYSFTQLKEDYTVVYEP
jgi:hypothetical protein